MQVYRHAKERINQTVILYIYLKKLNSPEVSSNDLHTANLMHCRALLWLKNKAIRVFTGFFSHKNLMFI